MIRAQTTKSDGTPDPVKTAEIAYNDFGVSLPKGSTDFHYEPDFGYMAFYYNGILSTIDDKGQVRTVPNKMK
jgi:hypothetical protein